MLDLMFPSGVRVSSSGPAGVSADWTGARQLPPFIHTDIDWDVAVVVDVDAPYPASPTASPFLHWLVVRHREQVAGVRHGDKKEEQLAGWVPMRPPADSPPHRYQLILFRAATPNMRSRSSGWIREGPRFDLQRLINEWQLTEVATLEYRSVIGFWPGTPTTDPTMQTVNKVGGKCTLATRRAFSVKLRLPSSWNPQLPVRVF
jgi:hypothetical protein